MMFGDMLGLRVISSQYAPVPQLLRYPKKGPYYQRRLKKIRRDPKNWSKPTFIISGNTVIGHPNLIPCLWDSISPKAGE